MPGNEMILLMMSPSLQYFWCHSIFNLQSICLLQMSNTDLRVCSPNRFSAVKVKGWSKEGEKSKPKNICRASNETPPKSLDPKFLFWISDPKKKKFKKDHTTQEKKRNWIYSCLFILASMAGIRPISPQVMYTTLQIVLNSQKNQWFTKKIFTDNYWLRMKVPAI